MKKYENPQLLIETLRAVDIITASNPADGTETTPKEEGDGDFNLSIG